MTTPLQLLRDRKQEISEQYNRVLWSKYNSGLQTTNVILAREFWENGKTEDLSRIKIELDKYNGAINILLAVKNSTF